MTVTSRTVDPAVGHAYRVLLELTTEQRGLVLCWFCDACFEHVGPGEPHRCTKGSAVWPAAERPSQPSRPKGGSR